MKFSIRDLLLVTMIVAILLAWWIDRSRLESAGRTIEKDAHDLCEFMNPFNSDVDEERFWKLQQKYYRVAPPTSQAFASNPPRK